MRGRFEPPHSYYFEQTNRWFLHLWDNRKNCFDLKHAAITLNESHLLLRSRFYLLDELLQILLFSCPRWTPNRWCLFSASVPLLLLLLSVGSRRSGRRDADWRPVRAESLLPVLTLSWGWAGRAGGVPRGGGVAAVADFWLEIELLSQEIRNLDRCGAITQSCNMMGSVIQ